MYSELKRMTALLLICVIFTAGCSRKQAAGNPAKTDVSADNGVTQTENTAQQANVNAQHADIDALQTDANVPQADAAPSQMLEMCAALTPVPAAQEDLCRTTYEVFVYSFYDSDGDGIGDLQGLRQKLDYINDGNPSAGDDLGCTQIWTMPVFPSPTYHKYDVTDYMAIDPEYGSMEDFDALLKECHDRGVRLILDLPLNHTSVEHPWFLEAAEYMKSLGNGAEPDFQVCPYAAYFHFRKEPGTGYAELGGSGWYYECRFWEGMPDLNLDNEAVREEIAQIAEFWLEKGVDGFRLDAVTSYYTGMHEQNVQFLSWFNQTVKEIRPDAYLVGEAWENQNIYSRYYASGIDSLFDFAFAGQDGLIANVVRGSRPASAYAQALVSEERLYASENESYVNAPFYTNHDMARGTGYYAYDDGSRTKLALALNLLMPGNAFLYYGEELGMKGSGKDENKRAAMQWSNTDTAGMCRGPQNMDSFSMKFAPLDEQMDDDGSIFRYCQSAIRIRNSLPLIVHGKSRIIDELTGENICVIAREDPEEENTSVYLLINTSEQAEEISLDGTELAERILEAVLTVSKDEVILHDDSVTLPAFGIAVMK